MELGLEWIKGIICIYMRKNYLYDLLPSQCD